MADETVFDQTPDATDPQPESVETPETESTASLIEKRLRDKDDYIKRLEEEAAEMRKDIKNGEELKAEMEQLRKQIGEVRQSRSQPQAEVHTGSALSEEDLRGLIADTITERERVSTAAKNVKEANEAILKHIPGEKEAAEFVRKKADELAMPVEQLKEVAAQSPSAFKKLLGLTDSNNNKVSVAAGGSVNTQNLQAGNMRPGTKAWWDNMRRTDRSKYWSVSNQQQILKDKTSGLYDS